MSDHRFFTFGKARLTQLATQEEALAALKKGEFVWLDFYNPSREDFAALTEPLGLSPLSIEDALDDDQIPKIEDYPSYTFILLNGYEYRGRELLLREFDFFVGKSFLVTSHRGDGERRFGARLDERLRQNLAEDRRGPEFLCHEIIDQVVDEKFAVIEEMQDELEQAEETILRDVMGFKPEEMLRLRRRLLAVRKSLLHEREVLTKICRRDSPFIGEKALYGYRDIYDHLVRFFENTEIAREMISNLMEMYLSLLNNRMTMAANRTNDVVKRLTYITTIFMPLTLLAGIGGMSEWSMMTGPENWKISYPAFFALMAFLAGLNYLALRWFDRRREEQASLGLDAPPSAARGARGEDKAAPTGTGLSAS
jgi:magnesium transporter